MEETTPKTSSGSDERLIDIFEREIEREIAEKMVILSNITDNMSMCKRDLARLRKEAVIKFYMDSSQSFDHGNQPSIHPAVKKLIGKRPAHTSATDQYLQSNIWDWQSKARRMSYKKYFSNHHKRKSKTSSIQLQTDSSKSKSTIKPRYVPPNIPGNPQENSTLRGNTRKVHMRVLVGNVAKKVDLDSEDLVTHKWMVYVRSAPGSLQLEEQVSRVTFFLHPSYKPHDVITIPSPPFTLNRRGWGEFPMRVQLCFKNHLNKTADIIHNLKLNGTRSGFHTRSVETFADLWIHPHISTRERAVRGGFSSRQILKLASDMMKEVVPDFTSEAMCHRCLTKSSDGNSYCCTCSNLPSSNQRVLSDQTSDHSDQEECDRTSEPGSQESDSDESDVSLSGATFLGSINTFNFDDGEPEGSSSLLSPESINFEEDCSEQEMRDNNSFEDCSVILDPVRCSPSCLSKTNTSIIVENGQSTIQLDLQNGVNSEGTQKDVVIGEYSLNESLDSESKECLKNAFNVCNPTRFISSFKKRKSEPLDFYQEQTEILDALDITEEPMKEKEIKQDLGVKQEIKQDLMVKKEIKQEFKEEIEIKQEPTMVKKEVKQEPVEENGIKKDGRLDKINIEQNITLVEREFKQEPVEEKEGIIYTKQPTGYNAKPIDYTSGIQIPLENEIEIVEYKPQHLETEVIYDYDDTGYLQMPSINPAYQDSSLETNQVQGIFPDIITEEIPIDEFIDSIVEEVDINESLATNFTENTFMKTESNSSPSKQIAPLKSFLHNDSSVFVKDSTNMQNAAVGVKESSKQKNMLVATNSNKKFKESEICIPTLKETCNLSAQRSLLLKSGKSILVYDISTAEKFSPPAIPCDTVNSVNLKTQPKISLQNPQSLLKPSIQNSYVLSINKSQKTDSVLKPTVKHLQISETNLSQKPISLLKLSHKELTTQSIQCLQNSRSILKSTVQKPLSKSINSLQNSILKPTVINPSILLNNVRQPNVQNSTFQPRTSLQKSVLNPTLVRKIHQNSQCQSTSLQNSNTTIQPPFGLHESIQNHYSKNTSSQPVVDSQKGVLNQNLCFQRKPIFQNIAVKSSVKHSNIHSPCLETSLPKGAVQNSQIEKTDCVKSVFINSRTSLPSSISLPNLDLEKSPEVVSLNELTNILNIPAASVLLSSVSENSSEDVDSIKLVNISCNSLHSDLENPFRPDLQFGRKAVAVNKDYMISVMNKQVLYYLEQTRLLVNTCQFEEVEHAVRWLVRGLPLIHPDARLTAFRMIHPYCASSLETYISWPSAKQAACEWLRAKTVVRLLSYLQDKGVPLNGVWSTRTVYRWSVLHGYSPAIQLSGSDSANSDDKYIELLNKKSLPDNVIDWMTCVLADGQLIKEEEIDVVGISSQKRAASRHVGEAEVEDAGSPALYGKPWVREMQSYVRQQGRLSGARLGLEPLVPGGPLEPLATTVLSHLTSVFAEDLLRRSLAVSFHREGSSVKPSDVCKVIIQRPEFDLFTKQGLEVNCTLKGFLKSRETAEQFKSNDEPVFTPHQSFD